MSGVLRPLVVVGAASVLSLAAFALTGGTRLAGEPVMAAPHVEPFVIRSGYDLSKLALLETSLYHVEESYVEPGRVDYERMYVAALEAVERRVPACMFRREPGGSLMHLEIGDFRTVLDVPTVTNRRDLQEALRTVATLLAAHLEADDLTFDGQGAPFAEIEHALVNGALSTLDPHSVLLPPDDSDAMDTENEGEFGGLGITIMQRQGRLEIEYTLEGTPAERVGLQANDQITRIDGVSTLNMSLTEAVDRLRGPVGAPVTIEVARQGVAEPLDIDVVRDLIKLHPVDSVLLEGNIGYVRIPAFHKQVGDELAVELTALTREAGALQGIILDMRDNPGGYLNQAVAVADAFLWSGTIVSTVDAANSPHDQQLARPKSEPRYPMAVLVNANSASASEIVAGALRNNGRAVIVGERTFGKGSVQNLHDLYDGSKLKLTISKYLTPNEQSIQSVGIPADIQLVPAVFATKEDPLTGEERATSSLYHRERVRREADLDKHLERAEQQLEEPAYSVHFVAPERTLRRSAKIDLSNDVEARFCHELLLASTSWRRADILEAAGPVLRRWQRTENEKMTSGFAGQGVDWRDGMSRDEAVLDVQIDLGDDGRLTAGSLEPVSVVVRNDGDETLYRLAAVSESDSDVLDDREFFFGTLRPGETRRYEHLVQVDRGYPTELTPVNFAFRDAGNTELTEATVRLPVQGQGLPQLSWSWRLDDTDGGDGDGLVEVGERIAIALEVENVGAGATEAAVARIQNKSGRALDILTGNLEPGVMRDGDGERCEPLDDDAEEPAYAAGCHPSLLPGERWTESFVVEVKEDLGAEGLEIELSIGDSLAYDVAAIVRSGFYEYFMNTETIHIQVNAPVRSGGWRIPPVIDVTRAPGPVVDSDRASLSGVATDDGSIARLMVFDGQDKVFYQGKVADSVLRSLPYTADLRLEEGPNTVTIIATDDQGVSATRSVVTLFMPSDLQAQVGPIDTSPLDGH